jgi:uncharacterized protein YjbI with pentapeptide repeats
MTKKNPRDLSNQDLSGRDYRLQTMSGTDFSGSNMEGVRFWGSVINYCKFDKTNSRFLNCCWSGEDATSAVGATFRDADLTGARMNGAYLKNAVFTGACLEQTDLSDAFLEGVQSGGITGIPLALPVGWELDTTGTLIQTGPVEPYEDWRLNG